MRDTDADPDSDADADWTVCSDGVAPYASIRDAVDAPSDGAVIPACPGTWDGVVTAGTDLSIDGDDLWLNYTNVLSADTEEHHVVARTVWIYNDSYGNTEN
jgi:hypothetical protein